MIFTIKESNLSNALRIPKVVRSVPLATFLIKLPKPLQPKFNQMLTKPLKNRTNLFTHGFATLNPTFNMS
jgi:hypothetical protein